MIAEPGNNAVQNPLTFEHIEGRHALDIVAANYVQRRAASRARRAASATRDFTSRRDISPSTLKDADRSPNAGPVQEARPAAIAKDKLHQSPALQKTRMRVPPAIRGGTTIANVAKSDPGPAGPRKRSRLTPMARRSVRP